MLPRLRLLMACAAALLLGSACGGDGDDAPGAGGRYTLDRHDFARRLAAEHLAGRTGRSAPPPAERERLLKACVAKARSVDLTLELRADGAFLARYADGSGVQRLAGRWRQDGSLVTFDTTTTPSGRVTTVPAVYARRTAEGLLFGDDESAWMVPHAFLMRPLE